jgi:hypothetical protein
VSDAYSDAGRRETHSRAQTFFQQRASDELA